MNPSFQGVKPPKDFDIEDVETSPDDEDKTVVQAGQVKTWEYPEATEKAKLRRYITGIVVALWIICTLVGLFRWVIVGDTLLLLTTPALLLSPLDRVLKYYFRG